MVRSLACTSLGLLLLAGGCGDSSPPAASTPPSLRGTVAGSSFVPADASALVLGEATCSFDGTVASATGLVLGFGSFTGMCALVTQTQGCGAKANATVVNLLLVRANVAGRTATAVAPGTYTVGPDPVADAAGNLTAVQAFVGRTGASCAEVGRPVATGGTIRIDAVGARVTGSADLTFDDGSRVAGTFDVAVCGFRTDVCTALSGSSCASEICLP